MGGLSLWHWLVVLLVLVIVFGGSKRLKNVGQDLGDAIKSFKKGMQDDDATPPRPASPPQDAAPTPTTSRDDDDRNPPVVR